MSVLTIEETFTDNGTTKTSNVPLSIDYMFYAVGTFNGAKVSLEASPDNGVNWFTVEEFSAAGRLIRYLVSGERIRIIVTGANNPNITTGIRQ